MYGAGWIEARNLREYERLARTAARCAKPAAADDLLDMAEAEWKHERYFRLKAAGHPLARVLRIWPAPTPKAEIRRTFAELLPARPWVAHQASAAAYGTRRAEFGAGWSMR
jgi:hypothetical protein